MVKMKKQKNNFRVIVKSWDGTEILEMLVVSYEEHERHYSFDFTDGCGNISKERVIRIEKL
jgi:hypothetical protein